MDQLTQKDARVIDRLFPAFQRFLVGTRLRDLEQSGGGGGLSLASQAEAEAGTNNTKANSPLRTAQQTTARLASQVQAEAGVDNDKLMTPLRVAQAIAALGGGGGGGASDYSLTFLESPSTVNLGAGDYGKLYVCLADTTINLPATAPNGTRFIFVGLGSAKITVGVPASSWAPGFQTSPGAGSFVLSNNLYEFVALQGSAFPGIQVWIPRLDPGAVAWETLATYPPGVRVLSPSSQGNDEVFESIGGGSPNVGLEPRLNPNRWRQLSGLAEKRTITTFNMASASTPVDLIASADVPNGQKCRLKKIVLDWIAGDATGVGTIVVRTKDAAPKTLLTIAEASLSTDKRFLLGDPQLLFESDINDDTGSGIEILGLADGVSGTVFVTTEVDFVF